MKIRIKATNIKLTPEIRAYVENKMSDLEKLLSHVKKNVLKADIEVGKITKQQQKGKVFRAEINLNMPGKLLRVESVQWDLKVAIDETKQNMEREIRKYKGKQEAKYKRGARIAKKKIRLSPLAWFKMKKGGRNREEGV